MGARAHTHRLNILPVWFLAAGRHPLDSAPPNEQLQNDSAFESETWAHSSAPNTSESNRFMLDFCSDDWRVWVWNCNVFKPWTVLVRSAQTEWFLTELSDALHPVEWHNRSSSEPPVWSTPKNTQIQQSIAHHKHTHSSYWVCLALAERTFR